MASNRTDTKVPGTPVYGARCAEGITGNYVQALNQNWHPEHFVCGGCGTPIRNGGFCTSGSAAYHPRCHADLFAPKCFYCAAPMVGTFIRDAWGIEFCQSHLGEAPLCAFCSRLVDGNKIGGHQTEGGLQCAICGVSSVDTPEDAAPVYRDVLRWAADRNLSIPAVPFHLTDVHTLSSYGGGSKGHRLLGTTRISTRKLPDPGSGNSSRDLVHRCPARTAAGALWGRGSA